MLLTLPSNYFQILSIIVTPTAVTLMGCIFSYLDYCKTPLTGISVSTPFPGQTYCEIHPFYWEQNPKRLQGFIRSISFQCLNHLLLNSSLTQLLATLTHSHSWILPNMLPSQGCFIVFSIGMECSSSICCRDFCSFSRYILRTLWPLFANKEDSK